MSEVDLQMEVPTLDGAPDHGTVSESADTSSQSLAPHGEHEDVVADHAEPLTDTVLTTGSVEGDAGDPEGADGTLPAVDKQLEDTPAVAGTNATLKPDVKAKPDAIKQTAAKAKSSMSLKPPGKLNGGPPTPLVKKIINSGTFGSGTVKAASSKPAVTAGSATAKPSAPALAKSTSASSAPSKTPMASSRTPATPATAPNRRHSVAPTRPTGPSTSRTSLSASASSKPAPASATRPSVVSPAGSASSVASRPRASVSEGVKRAPLTARQSVSAGTKPPLASSAKPPAARSSAPPVTKPTRTTSSITSIREVKEDGKVVEDLQSQLKEASESLATKAANVTELEGQVNQLSSSLEAVLADVSSKNELADQLEQEKLKLEKKLVEAQDALALFESGKQDGNAVLASLQQDLEAAKASSVTQAGFVESLRTQIQTLEAEVLSSKEALDSFRASASSEAVTVASTEHEALLKAQAEYQAIAAGAEALKVTHAAALQELEAKVRDLEAKAALVEELNAQVSALKAEKEENSSKLSELEIEILELKESQETIEDERDRSSAHAKALEEDLFKASAATQQALDEVKAKEKDFAAQVEQIQSDHAAAIEAASEEQARVVASLEALKAELASALAAHEQTKADALAAVEDYTRKLEEAEQAYLSKQSELSNEIKRIALELQGQEAQYNVKVDAVKSEHSQLLQAAFERAKDEAAAAHTQELQTLRAGSSATIEQIQAANLSALEDLKAEHVASLDSEVNRLEKIISTLKLDLKATQEDLIKAKASLETARAEVENLTTQRDEARAAAISASDASPAHVEEIARLTKELSNTKDDLAAVTEMLNLTKVSLTELSNNQAKDLEEAAKARADEVTKLRNSHDEDVAALTAQKSDLSTKLSDLEGELLTLKATIAAEATAPKSNGNGVLAPSSPGVTKEELQRLHEAHNLKVYDLQAEHEKIVKALKEELEASKDKTSELQQEVGRKAMEIEYLEQDQEENQEQITRLKEDLDSLTERLSKEQAVPA
ncbi:hypothetical protein Hypma_015670 [Hypsizygus marmoreus]|uniref:Uncharacterized protein n=1 Tax=Hypsizygus marmoreus TaxID=39966 RepID=A0A369KC16_HYPMA|nr:hypothetical protein Hypma_015670 [Hypsizygus marmoreus]